MAEFSQPIPAYFSSVQVHRDILIILGDWWGQTIQGSLNKGDGRGREATP